MSEVKAGKSTLPPQAQAKQPGREEEMHPKPESEARHCKPAGKLEGKVALTSGGDPGIGKSVAIHFAKEGTDVVILCLEDNEDADRTRALIEREGRRCLLLRGDVGDRKACDDAIKTNARGARQARHPGQQRGRAARLQVLRRHFAGPMERTFQANLFGMFYLTQAALLSSRNA